MGEFLLAGEPWWVAENIIFPFGATWGKLPPAATPGAMSTLAWTCRKRRRPGDSHAHAATRREHGTRRHAVIWRKLSFGTQSASGSRFVETLLTTIETCRQQDRNVFDFVTQAVQAKLEGKSAPSLLTGV